MSTKIYTAWRMNISQFENDFLPSFSKYANNKALELCKRIYDHVKKEKVGEEVKQRYAFKKSKNKDFKQDFETYYNENERKFRLYCTFEIIGMATVKSIRSFLDIDASINFWHNKGKIYIIPYGDIVNKYKPPKHIEEYGYWNNTDAPSGISSRQWEARGKKWNEVCLNDWNKTRCVYKAIDFADDIGIQELVNKLVDCYSIPDVKNMFGFLVKPKDIIRKLTKDDKDLNLFSELDALII